MRPDRSGLTRRALLAGASGTLALGSRQAMAEGIEEQGAKDVDTSDGAVIAVVGDPQLGPMVRDGMQLKIEQINATWLASITVRACMLAALNAFECAVLHES